jgi:hypothetical protein
MVPHGYGIVEAHDHFYHGYFKNGCFSKGLLIQGFGKEGRRNVQSQQRK